MGLYKEIFESVIEEKQKDGSDAEYDAFLAKVMKDKYGVDSVEDLSNADKKSLFTYIEKNWKADTE